MLTRGPAFVVLLAVSTALSGCGQVVSGHPTPAGAAAAARIPPPTSSVGTAQARPGTGQVSLNSLVGQWTGGYICSQGETAVRLVIDPPAGDTARSVFAFGPLPSNPNVPPGSFEMGVHYVGGALNFTARGWIDRPGAYQTVDLIADHIAAGRISGIVDGQGCTTFHLDREQH